MYNSINQNDNNLYLFQKQHPNIVGRVKRKMILVLDHCLRRIMFIYPCCKLSPRFKLPKLLVIENKLIQKETI